MSADTPGDRMSTIEREDIIADAMTEIGERVDDAGEPLHEAWRREFAEAVIGRLADDYLGAVAALCKIAAHDPPMGFVRQRQIAAEALEAMGVDPATCGGQ